MEIGNFKRLKEALKGLTEDTAIRVADESVDELRTRIESIESRLDDREKIIEELKK